MANKKLMNAGISSITQKHDASSAAATEIANLKVRIRALNSANINLKRRVKELEAILARSDGTLPRPE